MDLEYPSEAERFRVDIRTWIEQELPDGWFEGNRPGTDEWPVFAAEWNAMLHHTGWSCPTWPIQYGGRGVSPVEAVVFTEELARADAPIQPPAGGEILVGPTILHWGTDDQKSRFIPPIVHGEHIWCQGFSEPDAGSDLAGLGTSAVLDGNEWIVDGTKIWTSEAQDSDYCFMLVRTNQDAPRHKGISYFLMPMDQPGIVVEPIAQIDGTAGFNQVHFTQARCPADNVLGDVDNGWTVAMSTLGFERGTSATTSYRRFEREFEQILDSARGNGASDDPLVRQDLARLWSECQIMRINGYRLVTGLVHPEHQPELGGLAATTKVHWTEFHQRLTNLAIDVLGAAGQILTGGQGGPPVVGVGMGHREVRYEYPVSPTQAAFLFARSGSIFGGTSEIQRNIIAERVLGLPREPRA